jgi:hypothetical protein
MAPWNVDDLTERGPDFLADFVRVRHHPGEFAPEFSWLLLAEVVELELSEARRTNPGLVPRWAEVAAILYEGLVRGLRPQDELAREFWPRVAAHYRAIAAGSVPRVNTANTPAASEPHPI